MAFFGSSEHRQTWLTCLGVLVVTALQARSQGTPGPALVFSDQMDPLHSPRSRLKLKTNSTHSDSIGDSLGQKMFNSQLEIVPKKKLSHSFTSNYLET